MNQNLRRYRLPLLLAAAWLVSIATLACTRWVAWHGAGGNVSAAGRFRLDHAAHLDKGIECAFCHVENAVPGDPDEPRAPSYKACAECHEEEDAKLPDEKKIKNSWFKPDGTPLWTSSFMPYSGDVIWKHKPHAKVECAYCHGDMKGKARVEGWPFSMEGCIACHLQKGAKNECSTCHTTLDTDVKPDSHRHLWKERHGQEARSKAALDEGRCDLCHNRPTFCDNCHREEPPASHTNLWRQHAHGIMAGIDRRSCAVCHTTDFCVRCHEETAPRSHTAGWVTGPTRHCLDCHFPIRSAMGCAVCHKSEPQHETAPDPPDWHTPGMNCRLCHTPAGNGAPPLTHPDPGTECTRCHRF